VARYLHRRRRRPFRRRTITITITITITTITITIGSNSAIEYGMKYGRTNNAGERWQENGTKSSRKETLATSVEGCSLSATNDLFLWEVD
jgi:hypothetical protein